MMKRIQYFNEKKNEIKIIQKYHTKTVKHKRIAKKNMYNMLFF